MEIKTRVMSTEMISHTETERKEKEGEGRLQCLKQELHCLYSHVILKSTNSSTLLLPKTNFFFAITDVLILPSKSTQMKETSMAVWG